MPCPALVVSLAFVRRFSSLRFSLPVAILGQHVQTGRPPPKKANDNGRPTKKLNTVHGLAGTVAEFSVVHATVGLAQARPNYVRQNNENGCIIHERSVDRNLNTGVIKINLTTRTLS